MTYKLTLAAERDLTALYIEGLTEFGLHQADRYFAQIEQSLAVIGRNPKLARERMEITPPVRVHVSGAHMIIYEIDRDGSSLILRVRHHREDWASRPY